MSRFAAQSVHDEYGVPRDRIHVVVPGANLDPETYRRWEADAEASRSVAHGRLRLVMVSTDWQRKGLDRLLRALTIARRQGLRATLRVIGNSPQDLPPELGQTPDVEWLGRINKNTDAARFLHAVADADVGCILARYEAGGSVLREYHALGLAALATDAGGMPDFMFEDASIKVPAEASDEEIATSLLQLGSEPGRLAALRGTAWRKRCEATWIESVRRLQAIIEGRH
jgi:glycosyltransferase involved in cell wall biosynthesis